MPAATPIYHFPYPCPDETITAGVFTNLANAIDAKLTDVKADETLALNRPNAVRTSATNTASAGVLHVTTGAGSSFTIPNAGVWLVAVTGINVTNQTSSYRLRVRQNATVRFGFTSDELISISQSVAHCSLLCAVGDVIDTDFIYTGAGTADYSAILNLKMITRAA